MVLFLSCNTAETVDSAALLNKIIVDYQDHKGYDEKEYPLGLFTKEYYKSEASYAQTLLDELAKIEVHGLDKTNHISFQLLEFVLQDKIDFFEFGRYLNPILSDAGFHSDLTYMVRPMVSYHQVKEYLNKLNAIPVFVDQHIEILRESIKKGVTQPSIIFKGYESTYDDHIVENYKDSYYYSPFKNLPEILSRAQKDSVLKAPGEQPSRDHWGRRNRSGPSRAGRTRFHHCKLWRQRSS